MIAIDSAIWSKHLNKSSIHVYQNSSSIFSLLNISYHSCLSTRNFYQGKQERFLFSPAHAVLLPAVKKTSGCTLFWLTRDGLHE